MHPQLTVYYNTKCPVCDAGINWQEDKLIALVEAGKVEFRDINLEPDALAEFDVSLEDIRKRLHALNCNGELLVGADVPIALWRITPGQGWMAGLLGNFITTPITRLAYNAFAHMLYAWNRRKGHW